MKKSRWFDPYIVNAKGKEIPAIRDCWTCAQAGVYLIRHKQTGSVVYVGSSTTQLKSTIYRHFQQWTDKQQRTGRSFERKVYPKTGYYEIRFFKCTAEQALKIEKYLIIKLQPKDNPLKYQKLTEEKKEAGEKLYSQRRLFRRSPVLRWHTISMFARKHTHHEKLNSICICNFHFAFRM